MCYALLRSLYNFKTIMKKKILSHLGPILLFLVVSVLYFKPQYEGRDVRQFDNIQANGTRASIERSIEEHGVHPQWLDNMFGGMPSYTFDMEQNARKVLNPVVDAINFLQRPASSYFLLMLGFYFMAICFGISPLAACVGALGWGLSSYFYIIYTAGHVMKLIALIYIAPLIGSIYYAYKKNLFLGGSLAALLTALEIRAVHPQVTYYYLFVILALIIAVGVDMWRAGAIRKFFIKSFVLLAFAILGVAANLVYIYYTIDYTSESTRGKPILVTQETLGDKGLDKDYITAWSYGKAESLNMLIPNLYGGTSEGGLPADGEVYKTLKAYNAANLTSQIPAYWGPQPMTSGPVYLGAVILFIFVVSLFLVRGTMFYSMLAVTTLALMLAWGKNFMWLTDIFIDHFPLYNKFRTVSMILLIVEFTVPFLAMFALQKIIDNVQSDRVIKALKYSTIILGGLLAIMLFFGESLFSFSSAADSQYGLPDDVVAAMSIDRSTLMTTDTLRSLVFVILAAATLFAAVKMPKYSKIIFGVLAVLVIADMATVNRRYLGSEHFVPIRQATQIEMTPIDKAILADTTNYRVANFSKSIFNESETSMFHRSVGGYSAVKPRRYQDLIDRYLSKGDMRIYSLLNTKYIINQDQSGKGITYSINPDALGNAWFVNSVTWSDSPNTEIELIGRVDLASEAVVDESYRELIEGKFSYPVQGDSVVQTHYQPNLWKFKYHTSGPRLMVLSEVYYPSGWSARIGDEPLEMIRLNYGFFGVLVPEGDGEIIIEFNVPKLTLIDSIATVSSIAILALLAFAIYLSYRKKSKDEREE